MSNIRSRARAIVTIFSVTAVTFGWGIAHAADQFIRPIDAAACCEAYQLPRFGDDQRISQIFTTPDGELVVSFAFSRDGVRLFDFYNFAEKKILAPDQEKLLGKDAQLLKQVREQHHLAALLPFPNVQLAKGQTAGVAKISDAHCSRPYDYEIVVKHNQTVVSDFMVFDRLDKPYEVDASRDCSDSDRKVSLRVRYDPGFPDLYSDQHGGMYVRTGASTDILHIRDGKAPTVPANVSGISIVAATAVKKLIGEAAGPAFRQQKYIDKIEQLVDGRIEGGASR